MLQRSMFMSTYGRGNPFDALIEDGNTIAWYQASDTGTITKDGGNLVSRWNDKLGSGRDLTQGTSGDSPVWGSGGVTFNQKRMTASTGSITGYPFVVYMVMTLNSWADGKFFFSGGPDNVYPFMRTYSPSPRIAMGDKNTCYTDDMTIGTAKMIAIGGSYSSPDEIFIRVNNGTKDTEENPFTSFTNTTFVMGGHPSAATTHGADFTVKECIFRKVYDSDDNQTIIYNYFKGLHSL